MPAVAMTLAFIVAAYHTLVGSSLLIDACQMKDLWEVAPMWADSFVVVLVAVPIGSMPHVPAVVVNVVC